MPSKEKNIKNKNSKKTKKIKNMSLYANHHPNTSIKGYGYADKEKAHKTIDKLKKIKKGRIYNLQVLNTMYNRAKYHKFRTKKMEEAMNIFQKELQNY